MHGDRRWRKKDLQPLTEWELGYVNVRYVEAIAGAGKAIKRNGVQCWRPLAIGSGGRGRRRLRREYTPKRGLWCRHKRPLEALTRPSIAMEYAGGSR
mmetsp:Transcript_34860/g.64131  ORF Transcript_34860/g.64131 Transcript_34860/m.64131 type:complete len:97 (+) Transcript_34860:312-602(+)